MTASRFLSSDELDNEIGDLNEGQSLDKNTTSVELVQLVLGDVSSVNHPVVDSCSQLGKTDSPVAASQARHVDLGG